MPCKRVEQPLETCEPSCVPRTARPFFIPVVHSPLEAVWYVVAPELSIRGGRARKHGTRGSTGAHLVREARSGAEGHMAAPELTLSGKQGLELRDTWQHRSSHQQGGEVQGRGTHGGAKAHLCREVWSEAITYVAARGCTPYSLS
jgi:hypothetical protein